MNLPTFVGLIRENMLFINVNRCLNKRNIIYHQYLIYFIFIKEITQESSLILTVYKMFFSLEEKTPKQCHLY